MVPPISLENQLTRVSCKIFRCPAAPVQKTGQQTDESSQSFLRQLFITLFRSTSLLNYFVSVLTLLRTWSLRYPLPGKCTMLLSFCQSDDVYLYFHQFSWSLPRKRSVGSYSVSQYQARIQCFPVQVIEIRVPNTSKHQEPFIKNCKNSSKCPNQDSSLLHVHAFVDFQFSSLSTAPFHAFSL